MSISSIKGSAAGSFSNVSRSSPVDGLQQTATAKLSGIVSDVTQKLASGDLKGAVEGIKKLCDTLGVDSKKLLGALGLDGAAGGKGGAEGAKGGAEGAGGKGGAEGAGGAGGGAPAAGGAEGASGILELLKKLLQQSPELAKKLLENPELLKQLAQNPEMLQQLAQNPQALQSLLSGAPPELAGISQFQSAAPPAPVSLS